MRSSGAAKDIDSLANFDIRRLIFFRRFLLFLLLPIPVIRKRESSLRPPHAMAPSAARTGALCLSNSKLPKFRNMREAILAHHPGGPCSIWSLSHGSSRLLSLPLEIRNVIYGYLLKVDTDRSDWSKHERGARPLILKHGIRPAVLRVNRQIHEEAETVLWKINSFVTITTNDSWIE